MPTPNTTAPAKPYGHPFVNFISDSLGAAAYNIYDQSRGGMSNLQGAAPAGSYYVPPVHPYGDRPDETSFRAGKLAAAIAAPGIGPTGASKDASLTRKMTPEQRVEKLREVRNRIKAINPKAINPKMKHALELLASARAAKSQPPTGTNPVPDLSISQEPSQQQLDVLAQDVSSHYDTGGSPEIPYEDAPAPAPPGASQTEEAAAFQPPTVDGAPSLLDPSMPVPLPANGINSSSTPVPLPANNVNSNSMPVPLGNDGGTLPPFPQQNTGQSFVGPPIPDTFYQPAQSYSGQDVETRLNELLQDPSWGARARADANLERYRYENPQEAAALAAQAPLMQLLRARQERLGEKHRFKDFISDTISGIPQGTFKGDGFGSKFAEGLLGSFKASKSRQEQRQGEIDLNDLALAAAMGQQANLQALIERSKGMGQYIDPQAIGAEQSASRRLQLLPYLARLQREQDALRQGGRTSEEFNKKHLPAKLHEVEAEAYETLQNPQATEAQVSEAVRKLKSLQMMGIKLNIPEAARPPEAQSGAGAPSGPNMWDKAYNAYSQWSNAPGWEWLPGGTPWGSETEPAPSEPDTRY